MKIPNEVLSFAQTEEGLAPYKMFKDYWNHYQSLNGKKGLEFQTVNEDGVAITFEQKEEQMNQALKQEILRISGANYSPSISFESFSMNPNVQWATFAVVGAMIDMILPDALIDSIGLYTEIRTIGFGDSASFDVKPRDLFVVSKAGRAMRSAEVRKQFSGQVNILPENHEITVEVALYKVLAGKESLAEFVAKAIRSIEVEMTREVFSTFNTAMGALDNAGTDALRYAGYTQSVLVALAQKVSAWNGGAQPVVVGTQLALQNVLPADSGYRYALESDYVRMGYIRTAFGYDVMALPQVADPRTEFSLALDDTKIYILTPSTNKLVKLVLEGSTLSNVTGMYDKANLAQQATMMKAWGSGIATNSLAGVIELS